MMRDGNHLYWSMSVNPSSNSKNSNWRIGSQKGILDAKTYSMYIFFRKEIFNGYIWKDSTIIEAMHVSFTTDSYTEAELKTYLGEDVAEGTPLPTPLTLQMQVNTHSITLRTEQSTSSVKVTNATPYFRVVAWYSDNTSIARVNSYRKITAGKKPGKTYITIVMSTGEAAKIKVTVQKGKIKTKSISGLKKKVSVNKGKTLKLTPVLSPQTSQEMISYSSSNKKVATVSSKGVITARKKGSTTITIKSGKISVKCKVTVK